MICLELGCDPHAWPWPYAIYRAGPIYIGSALSIGCWGTHVHARRSSLRRLHVERGPSVIGLLRRRGGVFALTHGSYDAQPARLAADRS